MVFQDKSSRFRHADLHVLVHLLHLLQFRGDAAVRRYYSVAAEVVVVGDVPEGAAEIELTVVRARHHDGLVHPVPDAGADHPLGLVLDIVPILGQIADGVAHRVGVFAQEIGLGGAVAVHSLHPVQRRIHLRIEVRHLVHALVMDGTAVQRPDGIAHGYDVAPLARLVAQRPEEHRRMQAVAPDHPDRAVHISALPGRVGADGVVPMALLVRLVHDVQAIPVVQGVHLRVVRIMARTDRVQIVTLHQENVLDHRLHRDGLAVDGVDVVPVGPLEIGQYVVDVQFVGLELHLSEAVLEEGAFLQFAGLVVDFQADGVQIRLFRGPEVRRLDADAGALPHFLAILVIEGNVDSAGRLDDGVQGGGAQVVIEGRLGADILHMGLRTRHQVDVAVDAAEAEHVLVLQVGSVAPFVDFHGHGIRALADVARDVELRIVVGPLAVPHLLAVHPHVESGIDAVEMQVYLLPGPIRREREFTPVRTHGIGFPLHRVPALGLDEGRIVHERIGDVRVERRAVALHLPAGRNVDLRPGGNVEGGLVESRRALLGSLGPMELPFSVQEKVSARSRPLPRVRIGRIGHHFLLRRIRNQGRMAGLLVDGEHLLVLPVVLGRRLGNDEIHLQGRFPDGPALERAGRIGLQLPGFVAVGARLPQSQGHAGGFGQDVVGTVPIPGEAPELVVVARVRRPLDDGMLLGPVGIVHRLERVAVHQPENAVAEGRDLPDLAGIVRFRRRQDQGRFGLDAALRIQHQPLRRSEGIGLRRIEGLAEGGHGKQPRQER